MILPICMNACVNQSLRLFPVSFWTHMEALAKGRGKILAGVEPVGQGDLRDGKFGSGAQLARGMIETATVQKFHRPGIYQFPAVFRKSRYAHATMPGHAVQRPWLA